MTDGSGSTPDANAEGAADNSGEVSTDTDNTVYNATNKNNSNDSTINRRTENSNRQASRINPTVDRSNKAFGGTEPDIGCVLGPRFEKLDKKVAYDVFHNNSHNYICITMHYGNKVVCDLKEYRDPMNNYEENNMPKDLPT